MTIPYNLQLKPPLGTPLNRGHKLAEGLVYCPLMNEKVGTTILDSSGNGLHGIFSGNPSWGSGKYGSVLRFDGVDDFVTISHKSILDTADITIEIMFKCDTNTHNSYICTQSSDSTTDNEWGITQETNNIGIYVQSQDIILAYWKYENITFVITPNVWYHIFLVIQGNDVYYYIDGVLYDSSIDVLDGGRRITGARDVVIGSRTGATIWDFDGDISFVRRYNRALSASEIALLYTNPFIMFKDPAETALLGGYVEVVEADWIGIDSSHIDSFCGESEGATLEDALDGNDYWEHLTNHTHYFILDLGSTYNVQKIRGRSLRLDDPIDVNIYVSDDTGSWGAAVATGISTWQDTSSWVEIDSTDKDGRYVKIEIIDTEDTNKVLSFGTIGGMTIFDVYGKAAAPPVGNAGIMTTNTGFWGPTF